MLSLQLKGLWAVRCLHERTLYDETGTCMQFGLYTLLRDLVMRQNDLEAP
jgi:hypothetical protein